MTRVLAISILFLAGGCAATQRPQACSTTQPLREYTEASASALAFDPPIDSGEAHPEFARGPRERSAFIGFEQPGPEIYIRGTTNLETNGWGDFYAQESLSVRSGVLYR